MFVSGITQDTYDELIESIHLSGQPEAVAYVYVDRESESLRFVGNSFDFLKRQVLLSSEEDGDLYIKSTLGPL